ncbi:hypothetical protein CLV28_0868 [Sediminihabitans luteus]|uniref:DUF1254 domain-containing protein n=1 Tax=Sediminihabitans luteus TaxID=1138585 RepID=A0A2M9D0M9_9CELL|nr:hypothetical protein [Sediminihabitans luteus]PJJ77643.1 hypothetical protein CLV28_0868 [Sediminihabitans luteus]GII98543.1 murein transglycosylase [Sediminihabitans luteus]
MPGTRVTLESFAHAETSSYLLKQLEKAPVNEYFHNRVPVDVENQVIIRSNVDLIYSYAVVDVTDEATFSVAPSAEYQVDQIIDENHYVVGVVYPGETLTVRNDDLSTGTHVYVLGRTAITGGVERAHELQDARRITAATSNAYVAPEYDQDSLVAMRAEIESRAAEADFSRGFGTPASTDPVNHALAAELGWGGLPPEHAQYFQALATGTGCDLWTFDVPPLDYANNGYFSVIKYTDSGWLDVARPGLSDTEIVRDDDGRITICFGDGRCDHPNTIETQEGQRFFHGMRMYRPLDVEETKAYIERLRATPPRPA